MSSWGNYVFSSNIIVCRSSFQPLSILFLWIFSLQVDIISQHLYILALINPINKITCKFITIKRFNRIHYYIKYFNDLIQFLISNVYIKSILFIEVLYLLDLLFLFVYLLEANRQSKLPMWWTWTKIISPRARWQVHIHILRKVMPRPWLSADNSDSDYINLWSTRKQSCLICPFVRPSVRIVSGK